MTTITQTLDAMPEQNRQAAIAAMRIELNEYETAHRLKGNATAVSVIVDLIKCACKAYGIKLSEYASPSRCRQLVDARMTVSAIMREVFPSLPLIDLGRLVRPGHSYDHTTMIYHLKQAGNLMQTDATFGDLYSEIKKDFLNQNPQPAANGTNL